MKTRLWLLDINDRVVDDVSETRLWGIDGAGRRVLIIDRRFRPYFYLLLAENVDFAAVASRVEQTLSPSLRVTLERETDKQFVGRPVNVLKLVYDNAEDTVRISRLLAKIPGIKTSLEHDIRFASKYLLDNEVNPCGWCEVDVDELERVEDAQVDAVYLAAAPPQPLDLEARPPLRILSFSTTCPSSQGTPRPERDPIGLLSLVTNTGDATRFVAEASDQSLIEAFVAYVKAFDPDIISGYGINASDWPYLLKRAQLHGLALQVDRVQGAPHRSVYGHIAVAGRANVDLYDFADEVPDVKVKTLANMARYLGVLKEGTHTPVEDDEVAVLWNDVEQRPRLLTHTDHTAQTVLALTHILLDFAIQLANLVGLPLDHVGPAAVGYRTENYLMKQAHRLHALVPRRTRRPYVRYAGGTVLTPKPGLHENVVVLDFTSMYPNIMMTNNVSPDTYVPTKAVDPPSGVFVAPEVKHRFRRAPPGLYTQALATLLASRDALKRTMAGLSPRHPEYRVLDARQSAVKVITNAVYGYAGWVGARWYSRPVAEATTAWGRYTITRTIVLARELGLDVIYGDTDSIFVQHDGAKTDRLLKRVQDELGLEIRADKLYTSVLFTEAKKRYAGLLPDGRLDVVGLEVARGDWTEAAKTVQEQVLTLILTEKSPEKAVAFVHRYLQRLRRKEVPYRDLVIWKTLTKPLARYKVRAPHTEAARRLLEQGWDLTVDDKVGYVITRGSGRLYERAIPYRFSSYDELDLAYYETKQIIPSAHRVLAVFDVSEEQLRLPSLP